MRVTLLVDEEHFAFGFLAPSQHVDVGQRIDFFLAIDIDKVSHLVLSYNVDDGILLVFGHDQL